MFIYLLLFTLLLYTPSTLSSQLSPLSSQLLYLSPSAFALGTCSQPLLSALALSPGSEPWLSTLALASGFRLWLSALAFSSALLILHQALSSQPSALSPQPSVLVLFLLNSLALSCFQLLEFFFHFLSSSFPSPFPLLSAVRTFLSPSSHSSLLAPFNF